MFKSSQLGGPSSTDPPHPSFLPNYLHPSVRPKLVHVQAGAIPRHYKFTYFVYRNTQYRLICCYRFCASFVKYLLSYLLAKLLCSTYGLHCERS